MQKRRFEELEGLRGVAAIIVVIYHFLQSFFLLGINGPDAGGVQHMRLEDNVYGTPFLAVVSGTFMVSIFFVLSGFVLSIGFFQTKKSEIVRKLAAKRYLRLMLPALVSTLLALLFCSLVFLKQDVADLNGSSWLGRRWSEDLTFFGALFSGTFGIFMEAKSAYNVVLWTMMYEFIGSFIVFGFLLLFGKMQYRWIAYLVLIVATANTWYLPFILGVGMADLYAHGHIKTKRYSWKVLVPAICLVVFFGGYPIGTAEGTMYQYIMINNGVTNWLMLYLTIASVGAVGLVLLSEQMSRIFSHRLISRLGKYTFALYLTHLLVLLTVTMGLFLLLHQELGLRYTVSAVGAFVLSIPIFYGLTVLFEKYIDAPSVRFSSKVAAVMMGETEAPRVKERVVALYNVFASKVSLRMNRSQPLELSLEEVDAASEVER